MLLGFDFFMVITSYFNHFLRRLHQRNILPEEESWGNDEVQNTEPVEYHKFPLPVASIHLIDTEESFEGFLDTGLQVTLYLFLLYLKKKYFIGCRCSRN